MRKKLIIGLILFAVGILLDVVYDVTGIFVIRLLAGTLWPLGMVIGTNAFIGLKKKEKRNDSSEPSVENDNN